MTDESRALAVRDMPEHLDVMQLGNVLAKSGYFQDAKDAAQAVVKVLAGREMGFGPIASMTGVHIIKGKPSVGANLIAAAIKRSGRYDFKVRELTVKVCKLEFFERAANGSVSLGESSFSIEEAQGAGLTNNPSWKSFPKNMLFARAISNGAKWYTPDIFGGPVYTPDELGAEVDEAGDPVRPAAEVYEPQPDGPISEEQVKRLWAIARQHSWSEAQVKALITGEDYKHESTKQVLRSQYEALIDRLKKGPGEKPTDDAQGRLA